jgi:hypothetical protein
MSKCNFSLGYESAEYILPNSPFPSGGKFLFKPHRFIKAHVDLLFAVTARESNDKYLIGYMKMIVDIICEFRYNKK